MQGAPGTVPGKAGKSRVGSPCLPITQPRQPAPPDPYPERHSVLSRSPSRGTSQNPVKTGPASCQPPLHRNFIPGFPARLPISHPPSLRLANSRRPEVSKTHTPNLTFSISITIHPKLETHHPPPLRFFADPAFFHRIRPGPAHPPAGKPGFVTLRRPQFSKNAAPRRLRPRYSPSAGPRYPPQ